MRICVHPEHAQYGLGHIPGPPLPIEYAAPAVALPATYSRTVNAPVLNQGSEPWCEPYTAATGRVITQPPVGQDTAWSETDLATRTGASPNGTTTAKIEAVLLSPGALCDAGPDSGKRKPVASCQNISSLSALKTALMAEQFVGLAVNWYESWFTPKADGTLPPPDYVAGGHIFAVVGWDDARAALHCQNSWGTGWGVGGFFWLPYAYLESPLSAYTQIAIPVSPPTPPEEVVNLTFVSPTRLLDTRSGNGLTGKFSSHVPRAVVVAGRGGIPSNAVGIAGNVTVTNPSSGGYVAVGPDQTTDPVTSTLSFAAGETIANAVVIGLHPDGTLAATFVGPAGSTTDLILDVTGYFTA